MASLVEWDKQWRLLIPERTLSRTGTGREITLVGAGDHLQIWNRGDWEQQFHQLLNENEGGSAADGAAAPAGA
jgi:MraZ protein